MYVAYAGPRLSNARNWDPDESSPSEHRAVLGAYHVHRGIAEGKRFADGALWGRLLAAFAGVEVFTDGLESISRISQKWKVPLHRKVKHCWFYGIGFPGKLKIPFYMWSPFLERDIQFRNGFFHFWGASSIQNPCTFNFLPTHQLNNNLVPFGMTSIYV